MIIYKVSLEKTMLERLNISGSGSTWACNRKPDEAQSLEEERA